MESSIEFSRNFKQLDRFNQAIIDSKQSFKIKHI